MGLKIDTTFRRLGSVCKNMITEPEGLKYNSPGQRPGLRDKVSQRRNQSRVWKITETMRRKFNMLVFEKTKARFVVLTHTLKPAIIEINKHFSLNPIPSFIYVNDKKY